MKIDQLRRIIREEVRSAIKEELQDILVEAVTVASKPDSVTLNNAPKELKPEPKKWSFGKNKTLDEMLNQTAQSMTSDEYRNIYAGNSNMVSKPNFASAMATQMNVEKNGPMPGLDISKLDFVGKAKSVLDAANKKDKQRVGVL
jgi:hypothetical protein